MSQDSDATQRVRGDVLHVLQKDQVKHLKKEKLWYAFFFHGSPLPVPL
jgi:hypothetical protein